MRGGTLALLAALLVLGHAGAFNIDTEHFTRHGAPGQRPAMFGFAVAAHKERSRSWVLVGAPEAQTRQPGVDRGGAVFRCDPTRDDACAPVAFDLTGNNNDTSEQIDQKSRQWFGATLNSAGEDGPVVACAPRYVSFGLRAGRRDPVGTCFVSKNEFSEIFEYAPCRTRNWGYHRQGSCQAGMSASVSKDGDRLFVGAPGSWYWQGQVYSINPTIRLPFTPPRYKEYGEGQLYSISLEPNQKPNVLSTQESQPFDDDSYLGYSITMGKFTGTGEQAIAVGMPRGAELLGKIVLYTWDLQNIKNLTGEQIGAYFGYSLCAVDVDGDKLDDLIVGAPMYTPINNEGKYDVGRVYIIYQGSEEGKFTRVDYRDGMQSKSRFGLSLASLGDINLDGYGDFAVGAPYDGISGRGAVYIFYGSASGVREKHSQVIKAEDTMQGSISTFGFSLSGGVDLDSNQYNDLVVGAYEADTAFLFRAKPVVKMTEASVSFGTESKLISLDQKDCTLINRVKVTCTSVRYCFEYDGIGVDTSADFDLEFILDSKKPNDPRLFFSNYEGQHKLNQTVPLIRGQRYCNSMSVYIVANVRDKLTPIEVQVRYGMREQNIAVSARRRNPRSVLRPTLDQNVLNVQKDSINIQKNCGPDNVCVPDLRLMATSSVDKYLLGSKEPLNIDVIVHNKGEDAFEATYDLKVPAGVNYIKIERIDNAVAEIPVQCSPPTLYNNNTLKCDIGNPLPQGRLVHFKVLLEPSYKTGMAPSYDFFMAANSTNPEIDNSDADNQQSMSIAIWLETDLVVVGTSNPKEVHYNATLYQESNYTHESDVGPQVVHLYNIRNQGPSTIEEAEIFLLWPYETLAGDSLMYVLEQPQTTGNIKCEPAEHVNDFNLQIDRKRKSYLDSSGVAMQGGLIGEGFYGSTNVGSIGGVIAGGTTAGGAMAGGAMAGGKTVSGGTVTGAGGSSTSYSKNYTWSSSTSGGSKVITDEQKKRIDEEEKKFGGATGDGSQVHIQRAQKAHAGGTVQGGQWSSGKSTSQNSDNQWSSSSAQGGQWSSGSQGGYNQNNQWDTTKTTAQGGNIQPGVVYWNKTYVSSGSGQNLHPGAQGSYTTPSQTWYTGQQAGRGDGRASTGSTSQGGQQVWSSGNAQDGRQKVWVSGGTQGGQRVFQGGSEERQQISGGSQGGQQVWTSGTTQGRYQGSGVSQGGQQVWTGGAQDRQKVWVSGQNAQNTNQIGSGQNQGGQLTWYTSSPAGGAYNKSYVTSWNTTRVGAGPVVVHTTYKNTSTITGADGKVSQTESSTEYYRVGSEGEIGSSFNNRMGETSRNNEQNYEIHRTQTQYRGGNQMAGEEDRMAIEQQGGRAQVYQHRDDSSQGGSTTYGSGSYSSGGARRYNTGEGRYATGYNVPATHGWNEGSDTYGRHKWSTEETVNKDLINADSATFHQESNAGNTHVGPPQTPTGIGAMAAGKGYRVSTWDLGPVDSKSGQQGGSSASGGGAQSYSSSYHTQWNSAGEQGRDNVATDRPQEHFRWDRQARVKRESLDEEPQDWEEDIRLRERRQVINRNEQLLAEATQCPGLKCARVRCVAGPLHTNHEIWVAVRARVNTQTLKKLTFDKSITLTSVGVARVSRLPYLGVPREQVPYAHQASSVLTPLVPPQPAEPIPLWVVVLAACAGAALLLLLILLLYKCGFFKRNRPSDAPERQPLNRNGYGHGDEQL